MIDFADRTDGRAQSEFLLAGQWWRNMTCRQCPLWMAVARV